ncbi:DUF397 domain-containing protein [Streptomyces sp. HNM0663]|uniref:DUF397 domain-containing protein n=1 Tax=Streptomyces chengmaiensis TaxID=3040919 RepID=A0ABT6HKC6_9ACTN|nr:DUF397 domain-containing protein [Streptomyces chengmaiensis]MDH2388771.1 DUF397 domain-containing protein [Streptomyces chengmaiensis]
MRTSVELSSATWCKSSYSNIDGGDCVEVARNFPGAARWRKSSYSNIDGGNCVEVAANLPGVVPVRDSKNPHLPPVVVPAAAWAVFVGGLKA